MGKLSGLFLIMALVLLAMVATAKSDDCNGGFKELAAECQQYVLYPANPKIPPSDACCGVIQKADVPCLCSKITKETEMVVCMEKVVYVAGYCKRPLQPGSKCGRYTFPSL
uniref:Bifunctional inhibitor/plant lipid transfer protein/seed storage helical domain-containing protein n=1 Tax=Oryza brachyantha TaxID=4533 RepID=J3L4Y4_ORYBR